MAQPAPQLAAANNAKPAPVRGLFLLPCMTCVYRLDIWAWQQTDPAFLLITSRQQVHDLPAKFVILQV